MSITPDTKDWTWVLERPCPECGFDATALRVDEVGARIRVLAPVFVAALAADDAAVRTQPDRWSTLEYACHVRDCHRIYTERLTLMLGEDDARFANWDQDATAVADRYGEQDPAVVAVELAEAAEIMAALFDSVGPSDVQRAGIRSDGAQFTIDTFARYHLHDIEHHVWDITNTRPA